MTYINIAFARGGAHLPIAHALRLQETEIISWGGDFLLGHGDFFGVRGFFGFFFSWGIFFWTEDVFGGLGTFWIFLGRGIFLIFFIGVFFWVG